MTDTRTERWSRLRVLLDQALDLDESERSQFLRSLPPGDEELRSELERMLGDYAQITNKPLRSAMELAAPAASQSLLEDAEFDFARVGQTVGPYRLIRVLGTGGMGVVYLAERLADGFAQVVALKVVRRVIGGEVAHERFERERQILAGMKHPGIALLFDGGRTAEGQSFYTMEYVDGESIGEYCELHAIPTAARLALLLQVAATLAYAHQNLIVHRDIKPSNVLVTKDGHIKLVDFGLAKLLDEHAIPTMTQTGIGPMTPAYAAPEQFHNGATTAATDIYQFGVLCFRIITGRLPYRADPDDSLDWARAVVEEEPLTLTQAAWMATASDAKPARAVQRKRAFSRDLDAIVRKALAKSPDHRYRSMDAMIADLEAYADGRPVMARRAGPIYFAERFVSRWRYAVAATALAFITLAAVALIAVHQSHLAIAETHRANSEATRANAVANFLIDLFKVSDPGVNRGERLSANQILERGSARLDSQLLDQPEQQAQFLSVIGEVYLSLGDLERARSTVQRSVDLFRTVPAADRYAFSKALRLLAGAEKSHTEMDKASQLLDEAQALLSDHRSRTYEELSRIQLVRADIQANRGNLYGELAEVEKALAFFAQSEKTDKKLLTTLNMYAGIAHRDLGQDDAARDAFAQTYALSQVAYGEEDFERTQAGEYLGQALLRVDDLAGAEKILTPMEASIRAQFGELSIPYANITGTLAELARKQNKDELALQHLAASERALKSFYGPSHPAAGWVIVSAGEIMIDQGNYADALARMEEALALRRKVMPEDHAEVAHSYYGMSEALLPLHRYDEARDYAEKALRALRKQLPPDHPLIVSCLTQLGLADYALDDKAGAKQAWDEALDRATRAYRAQSPDLAKIQATIANPESALKPGDKRSRS